MFERFTQGARRVVVQAQIEARSLRHAYLGTEHLLLGLFVEEDGAAARTLRSFGVSKRSVRQGVVDIIGRGELTQPDATALDSIGVDLDAVRSRVEEQFGPGALERARAARYREGRRSLRRRWPGRRCEQGGGSLTSRPQTGPLPLTCRAKKVLELSLREAVALGHDHIGEEHILLGLLREGQGMAAQLLAPTGTTYDEVRRAVIAGGG
ncbi:Clp protease N-terminal domain-containing protein [soil metagenome]